MAKALTHLTEVVALGHSVEVDRFADLLAGDADSPTDVGRVQQQFTAASNSHCSVTLGVIPPKFFNAAPAQQHLR
jgi:hypothetical protein